MPKRKATQEIPKQDLRRSTRRKSGATTTSTSVAPQGQTATKAKRAADAEALSEKKPPVKSRKIASTIEEGVDTKDVPSRSKANDKAAATAKTSATDTKGVVDNTSGKSYWLLKAEPESRFENGVDVKFSIDDLAAKDEPEPWDGIRNYVARNNLRAMKKGDLAFFYQSNCKQPGIVGTMEIVREHTPDLSAHDPKAPYYDASSKPSDPKWSVVHVEFRSKFNQIIGLKELREMGKMGSPLENMQLLKQSRLSVSRVSADEWSYLMNVADERGGAVKTA